MAFIVSTYAQKAKGKLLQWQIAAELPSLNGAEKSLGFAGPVAGVHHNRLIIAGGANFPDSMPWLGGRKKYYDEVYVYKKEGNRLLLVKTTFKLSSAVAYPASCTTSQGIVYCGGENETGITNNVYLLQWDETSQLIVTKKLPSLPVAITNASAIFHQNIIYVAGGETASEVSNQFYYLNLDDLASSWKRLPDIPKPVSHAVLVASLDNEQSSVYLMGGRKKNKNGISELYSSVFKFHILKNKWEEKQSLPYALSAGTGAAVNAKTILLFGGDKGETFHQTELLLAAIKTEKDEIKKSALVVQKNKLQSAHPGFSKEILWYDVLKDEWTKAGHIPFDSPVTTAAVKWDDTVIIPSGEIKAGVRTPQILKAGLR